MRPVYTLLRPPVSAEPPSTLEFAGDGAVCVSGPCGIELDHHSLLTWPQRVAETAKCDCVLSHRLTAANPLLSNRGEDEQERDLSMNVGWIVVGMVIVGVLATRIVWLHERWESDLGFVSRQWLAEHRL